MFVLTFGYVYMTTYSLTKYCYYIERVYFIYKLFVIDSWLFIGTFSFLLFLYTVSSKEKRDKLHASIDILLILCSIFLTWWRNILIYHVQTKKVLSWTCRSPPPPSSPLFVATPLTTSRYSSWWVKFKQWI